MSGHFPTLTNATDLQRFTGMVKQLGKFVPGLADIKTPVWHLLLKDLLGIGMKFS